MKFRLVLICRLFFVLLLLTAACNSVDDSGDNSGDNNHDESSGQSSSHQPNIPVASPSGTSTDKSDPASQGGTITFQNIGSVGWYPSRTDPATGPCDAADEEGCCRAKHYLTTDSLTPWNEELIMTLRGPMVVRQIAVYQPDDTDPSRWDRTSVWDSDASVATDGIAFSGNNTKKNGFRGTVGNTCLVDVSTDRVFKTGSGSVPYCPSTNDTKYYGWDGSKMFILLATMPGVGSGIIDSAEHCGNDPDNNWYDAPWIGFSHGEMVRSGAFGSCHCYAKDGEKWYLADGCGQFNAFEVVNDNNDYQNFDLFSTNFFGYGGYVGEGPCGKNCAVSGLDPKVDLVNKSTGSGAITGAVANPDKGPGAAFRRPTAGYRYFLVLFDIPTRTVQMALIHPENVPSSVQRLLPELPSQVARELIDDLLALRLPNEGSAGVKR